MNSSKRQFQKSPTLHCCLAILAAFVLALGLAKPAHAQALGWEGETGVFVTPLAFTASVDEGPKLHPVVAYHYFNAGPVIGDFHELSIEVGVGKRFEFGFTHEFHVFGSDPSLSPLWQNGFEIFNGKFILVPENYEKQKWVPAVSVGFIARTNVRNVGNWVAESASNPSMVGGKSDGDIYIVASKVVPTKPIPIVLSGGVRGTDAELWGMGGNAPAWEARAFGAGAFVFKGPSRSVIILGFVSLFMDVSSEMIHSLLPMFMVTALGASALSVGLIEGLAESTSLLVKVFSGSLSDYFGQRKRLALAGYAKAVGE